MSHKYMNGNAGHTEGGIDPRRRTRRKNPQAPAPNPVPLSVSWFLPSKDTLFKWLIGAIVALVGAGWIALPAKDSDLKNLANELRAGFDRTDAKLKSMYDSISALRDVVVSTNEQMVRVQTELELRQGAPVAPKPAKRVSRASQQPKDPKPVSSGIFGF